MDIYSLLGKEKKEKLNEPQFYMSKTNMPTYNYRVYNMSKREKIMYFAIAFVVGAAVGYLFYGGIGKDSYGDPTILTYILNVTIPAIVGFLAGRMFLPMRNEQLVEKHKRALNSQFRDMLEALSTSLGAGKNVPDALNSVYRDLKMQYDEDAHILSELEVIISGINNNIAIEELLEDFANRADNDDIASFANVFKVCYRKGGNIKSTIRVTYEILNDKMAIMEDIETTVSSSKLDQSIMIVMPIALIAMIKFMSPEFASNFVTASGIISTTIAAAMFVVAYFVGKKILSIKI